MSEELRARAAEVLTQCVDHDTTHIIVGNDEVKRSVPAFVINAMLSFASSAAGQREGWEDRLAAAFDAEGLHQSANALRDRDYDMNPWVRAVVRFLASPSAPEERRDEVESSEWVKRHRVNTDRCNRGPDPTASEERRDEEPDGWLAVKVNSEGGIVMPYGPLHSGPDRPSDAKYRWAPFYLGEPQ